MPQSAVPSSTLLGMSDARWKRVLTPGTPESRPVYPRLLMRRLGMPQARRKSCVGS